MNSIIADKEPRQKVSNFQDNRSIKEKKVQKNNCIETKNLPVPRNKIGAKKKTDASTNIKNKEKPKPNARKNIPLQQNRKSDSSSSSDGDEWWKASRKSEIKMLKAKTYTENYSFLASLSGNLPRNIFLCTFMDNCFIYVLFTSYI